MEKVNDYPFEYWKYNIRPNKTKQKIKMTNADYIRQKKNCYILNELAVPESVMLKFEGTCIDARYEYEHLFLKTIFGIGIRNDKDSTYIEVQLNEWLKIDPATLNIYFKDRKEKESGC